MFNRIAVLQLLPLHAKQTAREGASRIKRLLVAWAGEPLLSSSVGLLVWTPINRHSADSLASSILLLFRSPDKAEPASLERDSVVFRNIAVAALNSHTPTRSDLARTIGLGGSRLSGT